MLFHRWHRKQDDPPTPHLLTNLKSNISTHVVSKQICMYKRGAVYCLYLIQRQLQCLKMYHSNKLKELSV